MNTLLFILICFCILFAIAIIVVLIQLIRLAKRLGDSYDPGFFDQNQD